MPITEHNALRNAKEALLQVKRDLQDPDHQLWQDDRKLQGVVSYLGTLIANLPVKKYPHALRNIQRQSEATILRTLALSYPSTAHAQLLVDYLDSLGSLGMDVDISLNSDKIFQDAGAFFSRLRLTFTLEFLAKRFFDGGNGLAARSLMLKLLQATPANYGALMPEQWRKVLEPRVQNATQDAQIKAALRYRYKLVPVAPGQAARVAVRGPTAAILREGAREDIDMSLGIKNKDELPDARYPVCIEDHAEGTRLIYVDCGGQTRLAGYSAADLCYMPMPPSAVQLAIAQTARQNWQPSTSIVAKLADAWRAIRRWWP